MLPRDRIARTFERGKNRGEATGFVKGQGGDEEGAGADEDEGDDQDEDAREAREEAREEAEQAGVLRRATESMQVREMRGAEAGLAEVAALLKKALGRALGECL
jgi:hypothetical protein